MKKLVIGLGLLLSIALPARAQYFVQISTQATAAVVNSTAAKNGEQTSVPLMFYSLQVKGRDAAASAWDVRLQVSLDGQNFSDVVSHQTTDGDGTVKTSTIAASGFPAFFMRVKTNSLTIGSAVKLVINAVGTQ